MTPHAELTRRIAELRTHVKGQQTQIANQRRHIADLLAAAEAVRETVRDAVRMGYITPGVARQIAADLETRVEGNETLENMK